MKRIVKLSSLVAVLVLATLTVQAQKFGYVNTAIILNDMPELKQAEANLKSYQTQLQKKGQSMLEELQTEYQAVQAKIQNGDLSPKQQESEAERLKAKETELGQYEQDMMQKIQEKRATELQPIYDKLNAAIESVAKENGFQFIFDEGVLLYKESSADVSAMVKSKLGL
ncbi:MAG: OmpH family outer membrane protein [Saprospiraceae bacterium]|nr:OmpH family outer membrane protein [Saprospiraceae bacterium]